MLFYFADEGSTQNVLPIIPNLILWLDADDFPTLTIDTGRVTAWDDKSPLAGNGAVTTGTSAEDPTYDAVGFNGLPTVDFDGFDDALVLSGFTNPASDYTLFFAYNPVDTSNSQSLLSIQAPFTFIHTRTMGNLTAYQYAGGNFQGNVAAQAGDQILAYRLENAGGEIYRNGSIISTGTYVQKDITNNGRLGSESGGSRFYGGGVSEVLIYNRFLTPTEMLAVNTYLIQKWQI